MSMKVNSLQERVAEWQPPSVAVPVQPALRPAGGGSHRKVLFLQTDWPMGMVRLARDLEIAGHQVTKVVLQAADYYYALHGIPVIAFRRSILEWEDWLEDMVREHGFDTLVTFNHLRPYNRIAVTVAQRMGLDVAVVELGLIRPQHLTAYVLSSWTPADIPELWDKVRREELSIAIRDQPIPEPVRSVSTFVYNSRFFCFALGGLLLRREFPHYCDQQTFRLLQSLGKFFRWVRRCCCVSKADVRLEQRLKTSLSGRFFLVPLQVPHDTQIVDRSPYDGIEQFLEEVLFSFRHHAPPETVLVLKTHPQDPNLESYREWLDGAARRFDLASRVFLVHRCDLGRVLNHALGVVTVNSTVGLTALRQGTAVKPMGEAIYDLPGLTSGGTLDEFWTNPEAPERGAVPRFVRLLESTVQARGSLIRRCFPVPSKCGVMWPAPFAGFFGLEQALESQIPHPAGTAREDR